MDPVYSALPPDDAAHVQRLSRLMYESRENCRDVLNALGAGSADELLARIAHAELPEHPAYEHYLAARILADTHEIARSEVARILKEANAQ
ncbi:hypothetical protein ACFQ4M_08685 [Thauera mechernichensis]|uniref:Uncharacterized protein n=1 Tax=Thauera mechernichensis TaxID=82788 RepID=A0ABW3WEI3_9RHOO|nr:MULTISPECIES: hypothetical protein [Thauera]HNT63885.1 hypothetical protein [Candidatus Desulfobacillus denitrificans]ENO81463.1 hypothetical protein B447_07679 [Thauera sp. 27]ENO91736.1 hypothetical protein C662_15331 [Thauera sp. 28]MDG3066347.1 hypothetical protein [Thauera mechernichensis]WBL64942.1 hypothetical protein LQF09_03730 [Thauera sp. WB-2]